MQSPIMASARDPTLAKQDEGAATYCSSKHKLIHRGVAARASSMLTQQFTLLYRSTMPDLMRPTADCDARLQARD